MMNETNQDETIFVFDQNILFHTAPDDIGTRLNPEPGFGGRGFMCDRYDTCLSHAANNEWVGFHCESCFYAERGFISFYLKEFMELDQEDDYQDIDSRKLRRVSTLLH